MYIHAYLYIMQYLAVSRLILDVSQLVPTNHNI